MPLPEPPPAWDRPCSRRAPSTGPRSIVTGGGTGLGKAIAVEFARLGAAVGILSRDEGHRLAGVAAVEAVGGRAAHAGADIRRAEDIAAAFDALEGALGPARVLVNNAAANFPVPAEDLSPNGWRAVTQIVLDGTFFCSQELFRRRQRRRASPAAICNILATQSFTGGPGHGPHRGGQGRAWATSPRPWRWSGRPPGCGSTPWPRGSSPTRTCGPTSRRLRTEGEDVDARRSPAGRLGRLHELGWAATWLCSPYASFVTGHTLVVDGANWLRRDFVMPEFVPVRDQIAAVLPDAGPSGPRWADRGRGGEPRARGPSRRLAGWMVPMRPDRAIVRSCRGPGLPMALR